MAKAQLNKNKNYYMIQGLSAWEAQKKAEKSLSNQTSQSALMLAYKDIYLVMAALCFFPILVLLLFRLGQRPIGSVEVEPIPF
jgi:DHA2 family multidrug resistance protein